MLILDDQTKILYVNHAFEQLMGCELDAVRGKPVVELSLFKAAREFCAEADAFFKSGNKTFHKVIEITTPRRPTTVYGDTTVSLCSADPFVNRKVFYSIEIRDVTERIQAQDLAKRIGWAVEQSLDGIALLDYAGRFNYINNAFTRLTGYTQDDVFGKMPAEQGRPETAQVLTQAISGLREGRSWSGTFNNRRKDGTPYIEQLTLTPIRNRSGNIVHFGAYCHDVTADHELRHHATLMMEILKRSSTALMVVDHAFRVLFVNDAFLQIHGLRQDEVLSQSAQSVPFSDGFRRILDDAIANLQTDALWETSFSQPQLDGDVRIFRVVFSPVLDAEGHSDKFFVNCWDVTEERHSQQRLINLAQAVEQSTDSIEIVDDFDRILYVNGAWSRMTGYSPIEAMGRNARELHKRQQTETDYVEMKRKLHVLNTALRFQFTNTRKDGTPYIASLLITPIQNDDGQVSRYVITTRDTTEETRLRNELLQLATVTRISTDAIIIIDPDFLVTYINPAYTQTTGYKRAEVIGKFIDKFRADDLELMNKVLHEVSVSHKEWTGRCKNKRKDGEPYLEDIFISPVLDTEGKLLYIIIRKRDVSKEVEQEEILRHTQRMEAVGRLTDGIAHDFNNMLQGILGFAELLDMDTADKPEVNDSVKQILKITENARILTRQLLAFSRKQVIQQKRLEVNDHLLELEKIFRRIIGQDIAVDIKLTPSLRDIMADASQLDQVMMNLLVNARDALTDVKAPRITVSTEEITIGPHEISTRSVNAYPGEFVRISVCDNGCGIPEDKIPYIFEPFFTTKGKGKGTGLGLAVVYGIMKQHKGWIDVKSTVGRGTIFYLYFPTIPPEAKSPAAPAPAAPATAVSAAAQPIPNGAGECILVVEDEPAIASLAALNLKIAGYQTLTAPSVDPAWELYTANRERIRLIFTDVILAESNGVQLANRIREMDATIPIIITSGFVENRVSEDLLREKHYGFLAKPYTREVLLRKIYSSLHPDVSASSSAAPAANSHS